jgi:zinc protease
MPFPHRSRLLLPILPLLLLVSSGRAAEEKGGQDTQLALRTAAALYEGIRTEMLDNGLRVYLKPVPGAPIVTIMVAYKVGSADEELSSTGLSHYLEHLMFKGTEKLKPGDIDRLTFRGGGANNAYTSEDFTIFHFDFPPDRWETALLIESDRMRNLRIDEAHEFKQEKGAVLNELQRNEDEPWDLELKAILPLLFGKSAPYGHPVIGEAEHVRAATAEIIKGHYDRWYHPNNASLVVCGNFDPDEALAKIKKLFGPIPRAELPARKPVPQEKLTRPARLEIVSKFSVPRLLMGFNTIRSSDRDYPALAVLENILAGGKTGRLYRSLVEGAEVASSVIAGNNAGRYPGWFSIQVELLPGKDRAKVETLVLEQLGKLRKEPVEETELKRAQHTILASFIFGRESVHALADSIAQGVTTNDLDFLRTYLPRVLAVTPADVQRVARKYFDAEQRVVVWSVPPEKKSKDTSEGKGAAHSRAPRRADRPAAVKSFSLRDTKRVELPNGLVLLLFEDRRLPLFVAETLVKDARLHEPADKLGVARLTGYMLDEGTKQHTGEQIAEMIENVGGALALDSSGGSMRVLAPDRKLGLSLLLECLMQPSFPKDAFARQKDRLLAEIEEAETQPEERARQAFRAAVYGKHPIGRPPLGTRKTVESLTEADCAAFHQAMFTPNNTILAIVGDFDSEEMIAEVKRLTADWKQNKRERKEFPRVSEPREGKQTILTMPGAAQLHFYMGQLGIRRDNPDYYKLLVMDYVFGVGPGFTDRLSARLRDREGLAYTVTASITQSAGREPGTFTFYIGTDTPNFARVKREFLEELNRLRNEKPTEQEVQDAKAYLLGNLLLQFTTDAGIGAQLLSIEANHLGLDYLERFRKEVAAVTPEDVQAMARKYLDPKRMVLVAAGAIDQEGKPLPKLPPPKR